MQRTVRLTQADLDGRMKTKIVYKLFKQRKDGSIGPLFIDAKQKIELGKWLNAKCIPTNGYALRPGWHCAETPEAPHLKEEGRVWAECEVFDFELPYSPTAPTGGFYYFKRPSHQGGKWIIAGELKVNRLLTDEDLVSLRP